MNPSVSDFNVDVAFGGFLFDHAPDALLVFDFDAHRFVAANPAAVELFECPLEELLRVGPEAFHAEEFEALSATKSRIDAITSQVLAGQSIFHEVWLRTAKGRERCCELRLERLRDPRRHLIRASYIDATDRINAQIELHNRKSQLAELSQHNQSVLDHVLEGIIVVDSDGCIRTFNKAATKIFGYAVDEVIGRNVSVLMPEPDRSHHNRYMSRYESTGKARVVGTSRAGNAQHKSGRIFPIQLSLSAIQRSGRPMYVGLVRDISEDQEAQARIERLAFFDGLTGLPNRKQLMDRLAQVRARHMDSGGHAALIFADLDQFKSINSTLGHAAGDDLLRAIANRFSTCVGDHGMAARLGGDEFAFVIEGLGKEYEQALLSATEWCQRLLALSQRGFGLHGHDFRTSASLGALVFGAGEHTSDELIARADLAMHQAKSESRDTYRFYDAKLGREVIRKASLLNDLRLALPRNELLLMYQPQVSATDCVVGAEALVRWRHPTRGLVSPVDFIPLAEQSGFVIEIGRWVLKEACAALAQWRHRKETERLTLAVNISATEFRSPDFVKDVTKAIEDAGANPRCLKLELTESILALDLEELSCKLSELRRLGVGISLDDFGTGYSSIAYLRQLPIDQLKIDRSFIVELEHSKRDETIVRGLIDLCQVLGLSVIAEGVETELQRERLVACGCRLLQGYLTGAPMHLDQVNAMAESSADAVIDRVR